MKALKTFLLVLAAGLIALGFNTIDAMMWTFYWSRGRWQLWYPHDWAMSPWLFIDTFLAYLFLGVFPFAAGCIILGWLLRDVLAPTA